MPGYGSKDNLANNAVKVYGSWFSAPGLVPPEPPRMLPLPADLAISGLRDRINVMSRPLEKTFDEVVNVIMRPKYKIDVTENFDVNVNQYLVFARDYLRGKDEFGNGPDEGYDSDGDGIQDDSGDGGPGGAGYTENQKINVVELIDVLGERDDIIVCVPNVRYADTQHLDIIEEINVKGHVTLFHGTDNVLVNYHQ